LKRLVFLSLSLLALLILIPGCITIQPQASSITTPVIGTFSSSPSAINPGGTSNLSWNVTGANSVSIDQGIGLVSTAGSRAITPGSTTVYTISATNAAGTVTSSAVAVVNSMPYRSQGNYNNGYNNNGYYNNGYNNNGYNNNGYNNNGYYNNGYNNNNSASMPPAIIAFTSYLNSDGTSTLSWNVMGATSVIMNPGIGQVSAAGNMTVSPSGSTVYTITATNSAGTVTSSATTANTSGSDTPWVVQ
jgi:hypothetical protein